MSAAQHTPGPWGIVETTHPVMISTWHIAIGQKEISFFPYKYHYADEAKTCGVYGTDAEMHANARLIAAAPDLLEALQTCRDELFAMVERHNHPDEQDGSWMYDHQTIVEADAAIAKATGGAA